MKKSTKKTRKQAHMSLEDRQECLSHGMAFKAIGKRIRKDQTTISKEVKKRIEIIHTTAKHTGGKGIFVVTVFPRLQKVMFVCNPCSGYRKPCCI